MALSKRAAIMDMLKEQIQKSLDRPEGPIEKIFRLLTYIVPFMPGLGWIPFIIDKVASHFFQMGVEDLGKWLDEQLGLGQGSDFTYENAEQAGLLLKERAQGVMSGTNLDEDLIKTASFLSLVSWIPRIVKFIWKAAQVLLLVAGVQAFSDLSTKIEQTGVADLATSIPAALLQNMSGGMSGAGAGAEVGEKVKSLIDGSKLQNFLKDPSQLMGIF